MVAAHADALADLRARAERDRLEPYLAICGYCKKIRDEVGPHWFDRMSHPDAKMPFGEDMSFFARCAQVGVPVHIDTGVQTGHIKGGVDITEEWFDAHRAS